MSGFPPKRAGACPVCTGSAAARRWPAYRPGFGSSKSSPTNQLLLQGLPASGVGVLAFDFPLHGESPDGTPPLWLETCFDALAAAEARLQADGSVVLGEEYGYVRPLKLTCGFFEDLDRHDLFPLWRPEEAEVRMVHVELDETIPWRRPAALPCASRFL